MKDDRMPMPKILQDEELRCLVAVDPVVHACWHRHMAGEWTEEEFLKYALLAVWKQKDVLARKVDEMLWKMPPPIIVEKSR